MPAVRAAAASSVSSFGLESRGSVGGHDRARRLLVVADLALAFVLLAGATLMVKSVVRLLQVDPGFDPRGVLSMQYSLVGSAYAKDPAVLAFTNQLVSRAASLPGVESAAAAGQIPMGGNGDSWGFHIEGRGAANPAEDLSVERYRCHAGLFPRHAHPARVGPSVHRSRWRRLAAGDRARAFRGPGVVPRREPDRPAGADR